MSAPRITLAEEVGGENPDVQEHLFVKSYLLNMARKPGRSRKSRAELLQAVDLVNASLREVSR